MEKESKGHEKWGLNNGEKHEIQQQPLIIRPREIFNNPYQNIANSVNDFLRNSVDKMKNFIE